MAVPLINGVNYSWVNLQWMWYSVPLIGVTSIEYSKEMEKVNNYGAGNDPVSRGYGNNKYSAELEIYRDEWQKIINSAPNQDPLLIPFSDFQIYFGGSRVSAQCDILQAAEVDADRFTAKQGDSKILIRVPIVFAGLIHK